jgi:dephospho-CoA kinase
MKILAGTDIPFGDMPGDQIKLEEEHYKKAQLILPLIMKYIETNVFSSKDRKLVISVYGGSGVGKSEIASLLSYYLSGVGYPSYTLSGDNYPRRIPTYNDAERLGIYQKSGLKELLKEGIYDADIAVRLRELQKNRQDANVSLESIHPWLKTYHKGAAKGIREYLGTELELDFLDIQRVIDQFITKEPFLWLKRMGREVGDLWYDAVDFRAIQVLVIEWTHGNNAFLSGIDIPIYLHSTPEETLEHRKKRMRDGNLDSDFTKEVLVAEQELLESQIENAKLVISKQGDIVINKL